MPDDDRGVFEYFRQSAEIPEVAGLAYASYAFEKYQWIERQIQLTNRTLSQTEIDAWIAGLPESKLDSLVIQATDLFDRAARAYMEPQIERAVQRAAKKAVSREVRQSNQRVLRRVELATNFWRALPGNLFVGLISSVVFVLIVAGGAWIFNSDPSPFAALKQLLHIGGAAPSTSVH